MKLADQFWAEITKHFPFVELGNYIKLCLITFMGIYMLYTYNEKILLKSIFCRL